MNLTILLPIQGEIDICNQAIERKMYARCFFAKCEKMIRDLIYYNEVSFLTDEINENICKQLETIKNEILYIDSLYKEEVNEYLVHIQTQVRIFRDKDIYTDYYTYKFIISGKYKKDIEKSYVTISDILEIREEDKGRI